MSDIAEPSAKDVRAELARVLSSDAFDASDRRRRLLEYLVEEMLAGRGERLKGYTIGVEALGESEDFDANENPIVRTEVRRLRRDLGSYYGTGGRNNPLRITIPVGRYRPKILLANEGVAPPETHAEPASEDGGRPRWIVLAGLATLLVILILGVSLIGVSNRKPATDSASNDLPSEQPQRPSIAVLPFLNLSGDAEKDYISFGITEQLVTELTRFKELRVLSLGNSPAFKYGLADPKDVHREFGTDYVLEGSIRATADSVRITSRLVDTSTSRYVWAKNFNETLSPAEIYEIQDTIAQEVAANLAGAYGIIASTQMKQATRKAPKSLAAYDCVLRYYSYQGTLDPARYPQVRSCLEQAVVTEPDYAEAWAVLANVYMQQKRFGYGRAQHGSDPVKRATTAARRAVALDPNSATAYIILSTLLFTEGDIDGFREAAETALRLNPNDSDTLAHYGTRLSFLGEWERGQALLDKAVSLNPAYPDWYLFPQAVHQYEQGNYEEALVAFNKIEMPNFFSTLLWKAATLAQLGRLDEAKATANELLRLNSNFEREGVHFLRVWQLPETLVQSAVDGLEKAGLHMQRSDTVGIR